MRLAFTLLLALHGALQLLCFFVATGGRSGTDRCCGSWGETVWFPSAARAPYIVWEPIVGHFIYHRPEIVELEFNPRQ